MSMSLWIYWRRGGAALILASLSGPSAPSHTGTPHPAPLLTSEELWWSPSSCVTWLKRLRYLITGDANRGLLLLVLLTLTPHPCILSSDSHRDRTNSEGGERGCSHHSGGNVSKPAARLYSADGLHPQQSVQETLQQHLCQHGRA